MIEFNLRMNSLSLLRKVIFSIIFFGGLCLAMAGTMLAMEKIAVYEGKGAVLAGEVTDALKKLNLSFRGLKDTAALKECFRKGLKVFIIPGGFTARIAKGWGDKGREHIRQFVVQGGAYIGICAGAYLAADVVEVEERPPGLDIIPVKNQRRSGLELKVIRLVNMEDPLAQSCPEKIKIWYQNGPLIWAGEDCQTVAVYENGAGAIVRGRFGKGKVILFSPHPEGNREFGVNGDKLGSLILLKNAIRWGLEE